MNQPHNNPDNDLDLIKLFNFIGLKIKAVSNRFISFSLYLFCFCKKNFIFLLLGSLIGLAVGAYKYYTLTPYNIYKMTIEINDNHNNISNSFLYGQIKAINSNKLIKQVSKINICPIKSYKSSMNILAREINQEEGNKKNKLNVPDIEKYINSIPDYEYEKQTIAVYSVEKIDRIKIQNKIIELIKNNPYLLEKQKKELSILEEQKRYTQQNISNIQLLLKQGRQPTKHYSGNDFTPNDAQKKDVFETYQYLVDQLGEIDRDINAQKKYLFVLSQLAFVDKTYAEKSMKTPVSSTTGTSSLFVLTLFIKYLLSGALIVFMILFILNLIKVISKKAQTMN